MILPLDPGSHTSQNNMCLESTAQALSTCSIPSHSSSMFSSFHFRQLCYGYSPWLAFPFPFLILGFLSFLFVWYRIRGQDGMECVCCDWLASGCFKRMMTA